MTNQGRPNDQISEITTDSSMTDDSLNIHSSFDASLSPKVSRVPRAAASESEFRICQFVNWDSVLYFRKLPSREQKYEPKTTLASVGCDEQTFGIREYKLLECYKIQ